MIGRKVTAEVTEISVHIRKLPMTTVQNSATANCIAGTIATVFRMDTMTGSGETERTIIRRFRRLTRNG